MALRRTTEGYTYGIAHWVVYADEGWTITADGQPLPFRAASYHALPEVETVTSNRATVADPDWFTVDAAGHFHAWAHPGTFSEALAAASGKVKPTTPELPTLTKRHESRPCPGGCGDPDCEGVTETIYQCRICGAQVEPGRAADPHFAQEFVSVINATLSIEMPLPGEPPAFLSPQITYDAETRTHMFKPGSAITQDVSVYVRRRVPGDAEMFGILRVVALDQVGTMWNHGDGIPVLTLTLDGEMSPRISRRAGNETTS